LAVKTGLQLDLPTSLQQGAGLEFTANYCIPNVGLSVYIAAYIFTTDTRYSLVEWRLLMSVITVVNELDDIDYILSAILLSLCISLGLYKIIIIIQ